MGKCREGLDGGVDGGGFVDVDVDVIPIDNIPFQGPSVCVNNRGPCEF